jgi:hypothetical protein
MASPAVIDFIRARLGNIKSCAASLTVVTHKGLRGRFREILAQDLLAPYLPPQIELLSGVIVGANNEQRDARSEDDIVLFDHSWAPLLLKTRGRDSIIPVTGIRAHIEVKSTLTLANLKSAVAAAVEINRLAVQQAPVGLIFAYESNIGTNHHLPDLLLAELKSIGYQPSHSQTPCPIQGVCILGRGSWFLTEVNGKSGWYKVDAIDDRELLAFVSIVSNLAFDNGRGLGTHVLDPSWLQGPNPSGPLLVP